MHRVRDAVREVDDAEEYDERPALKRRVERQEYDNGRGKYACQKPRLEFAPFRAGALDDVAHDRIVQRIEDTCCDHDSGDSKQLRVCELLCEHDVREEATGEQVVHHVAANSAQRVEYQVFFALFAFAIRYRLPGRIDVVVNRFLCQISHN